MVGGSFKSYDEELRVRCDGVRLGPGVSRCLLLRYCHFSLCLAPSSLRSLLLLLLPLLCVCESVFLTLRRQRRRPAPSTSCSALRSLQCAETLAPSLNRKNLVERALLVCFEEQKRTRIAFHELAVKKIRKSTSRNLVATQQIDSTIIY